jgi:signal peptidase I
MESYRVGLTTPMELTALKRELAEAAELKSIAKENRIFALKIVLKVFIFIIALSALLFLLMISLAKRDGVSPRVFGYSISNIKNDRMSPSLPSGSFVIARSTKAAKAGDAVIYTNAAGTRFAGRIAQKLQSQDGKSEYTARFDNSELFPDTVTLNGDKIESVILIRIPILKIK